MTRNALGKIFRVEKQLGRGDLFEVSWAFQNGEEQTRQFHHEDCDGLGALLLLSQEWASKPLSLPAFKMPLTTNAILRGLQGMIGDLRPRTTHWNNIDVHAPYTPKHLSRRVFSPSSSAAIMATASKQRVNLNALLLWCVNQAICESLLRPEQSECNWLLPVNTRRLADSQCSSNRTSSIGIHFNRSASMAELMKIYKKSLNAWHALGNEKLTEFLACLSEQRLLALARLRGERNSWIGSFSNLGRWDFPELLNDERWPIHLSIAPPAGTPCFPVGIGIITWQGHISLSLRLHAALCQSSEQLQELILDAIIQKLEVLAQTSLSTVATSRKRSRANLLQNAPQPKLDVFSEHKDLCNP